MMQTTKQLFKNYNAEPKPKYNNILYAYILEKESS